MSLKNATEKNDGSFKRQDSSFRNFIEKGGKFAPERERYHLYVSFACRTWSVGCKDHIH